MNTLSLPGEKARIKREDMMRIAVRERHGRAAGMRKGQLLRCHPRGSGDPERVKRHRLVLGWVYRSLEILGTRPRMTVEVAPMTTRETRRLADEG